MKLIVSVNPKALRADSRRAQRRNLEFLQVLAALKDLDPDLKVEVREV